MEQSIRSLLIDVLDYSYGMVGCDDKNKRSDDNNLLRKNVKEIASKLKINLSETQDDNS